MTKISAIAAALAVALGLAVTVFLVFFNTGVSDCSGSQVAGGEAAIGGPFTLVNQFGETVTDADVITGPTLIYFGYTFCPDICPVDVARNVEAINILEEQGARVTPVFITIDPARDTPEVLRDYAEVMHEDMIALTGTDAQIAAAAQAYRTYYAKVGDGADYLMDHLTYTYLVSPDGFLDFFRRDETPEQMAEVISCFIDAGLAPDNIN
jgi:protein SCO1/2